MKISPNSLIVKMIQNSFWFIEKDSVPKPTTSCGLFLAGIVSGLWHVAYTLFICCFMTGGMFFIASWFGVTLEVVTTLPMGMKVPIMAGFLCTAAFILLFTPLYVIQYFMVRLYKKGEFSKVLPTLGKALYFAETNWLTRKLSALCKPIDYKDN